MGDYDHLFKVLLIGDAGVGKSSILLRFTDDTFNEHLEATIGVDFKVKMLEVSGRGGRCRGWKGNCFCLVQELKGWPPRKFEYCGARWLLAGFD